MITAATTPIQSEVDETFIAPPLPSAEAQAEARSRCIEEMLPLVKHIASRMVIHLPPHLSKDDLIGSGILGLIDAVDRYDASRGCSLKTYCSLRIRGAILDELRRQDWMPRSVHRDAKQLRNAQADLAQELGREATEDEVRGKLGMKPEEFESFLDRVKPIYCISLQESASGSENPEPLLFEDVISSDQFPDGSQQLMKDEKTAILRKVLNDLPVKMSQVLSLYYMEDLRLKEIAEILDLTESRVSQIHTLAVSRLRSAFERACRN